MHKSISISVFVFLLFCKAEAQNEFVHYKFWITFTDKKHNEYSLDKPEEYLSERAINRRINQNISFDSADLPVSRLYIDSLQSIAGVSTIYSSKWFNAVLAKISDLSMLEIIEDISFVKNILYVKPKLTEDFKTKTDSSPLNINKIDKSEFIPIVNQTNSGFFKKHSAKKNQILSNQDYGYSKPQIELINGIPLHNKGYKGQGMLIALMDAGYTNLDSIKSFAHLWENQQIVGWKDFVNPESDIFSAHSHGTYVLSVIAAMEPNRFFGTATEADFLLLRTEDTHSEFLIEECNWIVGAEYADSAGVDIINTSLGYTVFDDPVQNHTYKNMDGETTLISRASNIAFEKGMLIITSAGNYGNSEWKYISAPADSYASLAVGAVDEHGEIATFSSIGPSYDNRVKPDVMAVGSNTIAVNIDGDLVYAGGTSLSSPLITGMAACLWQSHPNRTAKEIKKAIIESSDRAYFPDFDYGYGIPDFEKAYNLLKNDFKLKPLVNIFPNPFLNHFYLSLYFNENIKIHLQLINLKGQVIAEDIHYATEGFNTFSPFNNLDIINQGLHILRIEAGNKVYSIKVIKS